MSDDVELVVGGQRYFGWKAIRITRSIESLAGSFDLEANDRWGDGNLWPIAEEDPCRVTIDGITVIDGYVDKRHKSTSKDARTLSYSGRDRAAALVDNSAVLSKWTYHNVNVADFAATIAAPFGIKVSVQAGLALAKVAKLVVSPGDTAYEAIRTAISDQGVMLVSDGAGGIVITRSGSTRAASLVEAANVLTADADYDSTERYRRYVILTQAAGTDEAAGEACRIQAEAFDEGVRRADRVLMIRPEKAYSVADARKRADWEARTRAARAEAVTIVVQGWKQPNDALWAPNAITRVRATDTAGANGDMLITQVEYSISNEHGRTTQLRLMRPDAFTPEPKTATVKASGGAWKELDKGGL
jgi:prophage tail gpP-like protein